MGQRVTLASRLPEIAAELRPRVSAAVKSGAEAIAEDARMRVHFGEEDPHLRESITVRRYQAAGYLVLVEAQDDDGLYYGWFVEFGTAHAPPYPFLLPAAEGQLDHVEDLISASLRGL